MKNRIVSKILWVLISCSAIVSLYGYEDNTHQALTKRALQLAMSYGSLATDVGVLTNAYADDVAKEYGKAVIENQKYGVVYGKNNP